MFPELAVFPVDITYPGEVTGAPCAAWRPFTGVSILPMTGGRGRRRPGRGMSSSIGGIGRDRQDTRGVPAAAARGTPRHHENRHTAGRSVSEIRLSKVSYRYAHIEDLDAPTIYA